MEGVVRREVAVELAREAGGEVLDGGGHGVALVAGVVELVLLGVKGLRRSGQVIDIRLVGRAGEGADGEGVVELFPDREALLPARVDGLPWNSR